MLLLYIQQKTAIDKAAYPFENYFTVPNLRPIHKEQLWSIPPQTFVRSPYFRKFWQRIRSDDDGMMFNQIFLKRTEPQA